MKDLRSFVLNGLHFYKVRRILSGSISVREEKNVLRESMQHLRYIFVCAVRVTAKLSVVSACSLVRLDDVSWTVGTFGHEEAACYWEGKAQCRARAAPSPSPHCI